MVDLYERIKDDEPRKYLAGLLLMRTDVSTSELNSLDDVPRLVRGALGASSDVMVSRDDQIASYLEKADDLLRAAAGPASTEHQQAEQILQLARHVTIGWALVRNDEAILAEALKKPPASLASKKEESSSDTDSEEPSSATDEPLNRVKTSSELLRRSTASWQTRLRVLDGIAALAEVNPASLDMDAADNVADYLVSSRPAAEQRQRLLAVPRLRDWVDLRIALAHEIGEVAANDFQAKEVMSAYLGEAADSFGSSSLWPVELRIRLLTEALSAMPTSAAKQSEPSSLDSLRDLLREELAMQAQVISVPREKLEGAASPAQVRRAMIEVYVASLTANVASTDSTRAVLTQFPHALTAAEYAAPNDLALIVMLDRSWLQLLAWEHDLNAPAGAGAASIVEQLELADRKSSGLLDQLRAGEASLVRLYVAQLRDKS